MVELDGRSTAKFSEDKHTMPGTKQVFRFASRDVIACSWECIGCGPDGEAAPRALLQPVILNGELVERPMRTAAESRAYAAECLKRLPTATRSLFDTEQQYPVSYSDELELLLERVQDENRLLRRGHAD
jgi:nicotinate phosphoribosyltransferase